MLTREQIDAYVAERGPYLYHLTRAENLPAIAKDGIRPWSDGLSSGYKDSVLEPRRDHTYIGSSAYVCQAGFKGIMLRIDLRLLDPATLDVDEDQLAFGLARRSAQPELDKELAQVEDLPKKIPGVGVKVPSPDEWRCKECVGEGCAACHHLGWDYSLLPKMGMSRGEWAERYTDIIDSPDITYYSLRHGSVSVRGGIPREALSIDPAQAFPDHFVIDASHVCINPDGHRANITINSGEETIDASGIDFGLIRDEEVTLGVPARSSLFGLLEVFAGVAVPVEPLAFPWQGKTLSLVVDSKGSIVSPNDKVGPRRDLLERCAEEIRVKAILERFPLGLDMPAPAPELEDLEDALWPVSKTSASAAEISL